MPETMMSSIETFAKNRMESIKESTNAHATEESILKVGGFKLSQWDTRFGGSFKSANKTMRFQ